MGDTLNEMCWLIQYPINLGTNFITKTISNGFGKESVCAISTNNTIKCWGRNIYGQLGYGDILDRGDDPNEMGNNLNTINLGDNFIPNNVCVGNGHTCVLSINGNVKCFGKNNYGQLGYGDTITRGTTINDMGNNLPIVNLGNNFIVKKLYCGAYTNCVISINNTVKCWGFNAYGMAGVINNNIYAIGLNTYDMGNNLTELKYVFLYYIYCFNIIYIFFY